MHSPSAAVRLPCAVQPHGCTPEHRERLLLTRPTRRRGALAALLALWLLVGLAPGAVQGGGLSSSLSPAAAESGTPRFYAATGQTLAGEFTAFYDAHGGLPVFGYPITGAHYEGNYLVQYCERERLEYHAENAGTPYVVLLGRLGADLTAGRMDDRFAPAPASAFLPAQTVYVRETGHRLGGEFLAYWQSHGGVTMFGYPISEELVENGLRTQWFERARFEYHPELPPEFRVSLGLLGREVLAERDIPAGEITVAPGPSHARHLELGLAQGGESADAGFLHNVVPLIDALHVPLIRIDNIYSHYSVVGRGTDGRLTYNWAQLDQVVDDVRAMGAQPLLCLSYTPAVMSPDGSPIQPPTSLAEWRQLVQATVTHFNGERKLGLRYWEVWNEPNQWSFWRGSWPDYLSLYDASRQAARAADPAVLLGGPARSDFDAGAFSWFLGHQDQTGAGGGVEFLSWHAYGVSPAALADQVGTARNVLAAHPAFHPELAITEFSVLQGGDDDTSVDHASDTSVGAAYVLSALEALERAGLDRAFLFEVKDGYNPAGAYWGRWGITTFDGRTKPTYHALQAYQELGADRLPVQTGGTPGLGALAAAPGGVPHLLAWNTGPDPVHAHFTVPPDWQTPTFAVTVFDATHNNPQATGDDHVTPYGDRSGSGLVFDLSPGSVLVLTAH